MIDSTPSGTFGDVNEAVGEKVETETTPSERVREVISREDTQRSAETVAADARTSSETARTHLTALAEQGFVATSTGDHGGTDYRRSPESLVMEQATEMLSQVSVDELMNRIAAMPETISEFQTEYGVEVPDELMIEQANQMLSAASENERERRPDTSKNGRRRGVISRSPTLRSLSRTQNGSAAETQRVLKRTPQHRSA
jgi:predicted ArsR family transcriptional regulator